MKNSHPATPLATIQVIRKCYHMMLWIIRVTTPWCHCPLLLFTLVRAYSSLKRRNPCFLFFLLHPLPSPWLSASRFPAWSLLVAMPPITRTLEWPSCDSSSGSTPSIQYWRTYKMWNWWWVACMCFNCDYMRANIVLLLFWGNLAIFTTDLKGVPSSFSLLHALIRAQLLLYDYGMTLAMVWIDICGLVATCGLCSILLPTQQSRY